MNKKFFPIILGIFIIIQAGFSVGLINPGESDQSSSTMGFEKNRYDWLLDPVYFGKIEKSTIFFSLDSSAGQFGANTVGDGFRGGFAWIMNGFSPLFAVNYRTTATSSAQSSDNNENTEYDYGSYDTATGRYATINEIVNITTSANPYHRLMFHFGGRLDGPVSFDLQTYWYMDRENGNSSSHTDQYTNTASVSPASLSSKGNLTETVYNLIANADNLLAVES